MIPANNGSQSWISNLYSMLFKYKDLPKSKVIASLKVFRSVKLTECLARDDVACRISLKLVLKHD